MQFFKQSITGNIYYLDDWGKFRIDYNPNQPRDARGRWSSGGGGGGGRRSSGGGGIAERLQRKKVSELQAIAKDQGIDIDSLSYKNRKSVLAKAIEAKMLGENLREKGLLKPTKNTLRKSNKSDKSDKSEVKPQKPEKEKEPVKKGLQGYKKSLPKEQQKEYHSTKTQEDFEKDVSFAFDKWANDTQYKDSRENALIPVYRIRRELGESVSRDDFNKYLLYMQAKGKIQLLEGSVEDSLPSKIRDSISTKLSGLRGYVKLSDESLPKLNEKETSAIAAKLKNRPELDPLGSARKFQEGKKIINQKDFDTEVNKIYDTLSKEFNNGRSVPIWQVREALGNRISKDEFDNYIFNKFTPTHSPSPDQRSVEEKGGIKSKFRSEISTHITRD